LKLQCQLLLLVFFAFSVSCFADELIIEPDQGPSPLLSAIANAHTSIDLVMYGLTDKRFLQALAQAKNKRKNIHILLEPHPYHAENENTAAIHFLQQAHIALQWPSAQFKLLHQKTFLFDQQSALIMTFNLTYAAFKKERNFALLITNPSMVQEIKNVFKADWTQQKIIVQHPSLVWSPDNSRIKILQFIQQAQSEIKIYTQNIADYSIIGALTKAARSNVKVQILLSSLPTKKRLNYLTQAGVVIHFSKHEIIHAKVIMIDQKQALIGSINLTKPSLDENRELSVITADPHVIHDLVKTFNQDWQTALRKETYE
jgi:cardiolipin synthase